MLYENFQPKKLLVIIQIIIRLYYAGIDHSNCTTTGILFHLEYLLGHLEYLLYLHGNQDACLRLALALHINLGCHGGAFHNQKALDTGHSGFYSCTESLVNPSNLAFCTWL